MAREREREGSFTRAIKTPEIFINMKLQRCEQIMETRFPTLAVERCVKDAYCFQSPNVNYDRSFTLIYAGAVIIIANAPARRYDE